MLAWMKGLLESVEDAICMQKIVRAHAGDPEGMREAVLEALRRRSAERTEGPRQRGLKSLEPLRA